MGPQQETIGMDIGWREAAEFFGGLWLVGVTWFTNRLIGRVDRHEDELKRIEVLLSEAATIAKANAEGISELRVENRDNTKMLLQAITDK